MTDEFGYEIGERVLYFMGPDREVDAVVTARGKRNTRSGFHFYGIQPFFEDGRPMRRRNVAVYSIRKPEPQSEQR